MLHALLDIIVLNHSDCAVRTTDASHHHRLHCPLNSSLFKSTYNLQHPVFGHPQYMHFPDRPTARATQKVYVNLYFCTFQCLRSYSWKLEDTKAVKLTGISNSLDDWIKLTYGRVQILVSSWTVSVDRDALVGIATTIRGSNSGGGELFRTRPDRLCGQPSPLHSR